MDNSPTGLFDSYEQDFRQIIDSVRIKLDGDGRDERGEQRKAALRRADMELDEADEMISQMEIEIQGIPQSIRQQYQIGLRTAKGDLTRYKKLSKDQHSQFSRAELLASPGRVGSPSSDEPYGSTSDRTRLLAGTATLEDGSRRLQESQRIALETEDQGAEILVNLRSQREQIENARDTLRTADSSIDRASGTLKKMIRRMYQQRVVTAAIIILLVLLIGIIIYEKLFG
ncbi:vesicle transport v-SNARE protein N-terminus-domain-containing protein [Scleroderma yunnanense]